MKHIITAFVAMSFVIFPSFAFAQQGYQFTTSPATNITQTSATISGYSSGSVTQTWVEINVGNGNVLRLGQINGAGQVSATASNLQCNTTYYYQAAGQVSGGITNGSPLSFTTLACNGGGTGNYQFTTSPATNITQTSATISGYSSGSVTQTWVEINVGNGNVLRLGQINGAGQVSATASNLQCNTTYYYQAAGQVSGGITNGSPLSFTTLACNGGGGNGGAVAITSFTANPVQVTNGGNTTLSWTSTGATSCMIEGQSLATSGSRSFGPINGTRSYTISCFNGQGFSDSRSLTVFANQDQTNSVRIDYFTASPTQVSNGGYSTLTWGATYASSCSLSTLGTVGTSGSRSVGPIYGTQTYSLTCYGTNGSQDSRTVSVFSDQNSGGTVRIDYLNASPVTVSNGGYTTLTWGSSNASSCSLSEQGTVNVSGSRSVGPIFGTRTYTLTCYGNNGSQDSRAVTVSTDQQNGTTPTISSLTASPSQVSNGGYSTLTWYSYNASYCNLDGSTVSTSGSRSVGPIYGTRSYTLICYGNNGGGSDSRTVYVYANGTGGDGTYPTISYFNASPVQVSNGGYSTLTWGSNADYCNASGDWYGSKSSSGSESVGPIYGTKTYTLVCYRNGNQVSQTVTVYTGNNGGGTQVDGAITNFATRVLQTSAQLNGIALTSNGRSVDGWFEWGSTTGLGFSTPVQFLGSNPTNNFQATLTGLVSGRTYYYRAVARTNNGTFYGDILHFTTSTSNPIYINPTPIIVPPQATTTLTYGRPVFMDVQVEKLANDAIRGTDAEFRISYRSLTDKTLQNVLVKISLPEEFQYVSASRGTYAADSRTLTLSLGSLPPRISDSFMIRVHVLDTAQVGKTVAVTAYGNYTVPAENNLQAYEDEVVSYVLLTIQDAPSLNAAAVGLAGLFPGSILGWLLLIVILLAIIFLLRQLYLSFVEYKSASK